MFTSCKLFCLLQGDIILVPTKQFPCFNHKSPFSVFGLAHVTNSAGEPIRSVLHRCPNYNVARATRPSPLTARTPGLHSCQMSKKWITRWIIRLLPQLMNEIQKPPRGRDFHCHSGCRGRGWLLYRVFQVSCMIKNRRISAPRAATVHLVERQINWRNMYRLTRIIR